MKKESNFLGYLTGNWALLAVTISLYFLSFTMNPTVNAQPRIQPDIRSISLESWQPSEVRTIIFDEKPVVFWRRNLSEMATAMAQLYPETSLEEWSLVLNDGTLELEIGSAAYARLEWFLVSPINVGGYGCIVLTKAGDYDGFFDPCQAVHFDMWGRPKKGATQLALEIIPAQFSEDQRVVTIDLTEMPSMR